MCGWYGRVLLVFCGRIRVILSLVVKMSLCWCLCVLSVIILLMVVFLNMMISCCVMLSVFVIFLW